MSELTYLPTKGDEKLLHYERRFEEYVHVWRKNLAQIDARLTRRTVEFFFLTTTKGFISVGR